MLLPAHQDECVDVLRGLLVLPRVLSQDLLQLDWDLLQGAVGQRGLGSGARHLLQQVDDGLRLDGVDIGGLVDLALLVLF